MADQDLSKMKTIISHLQELNNLQQGMMERISKIELELSEAPDEELGDILSTVHSNAANNTDLIKEATETYTMKYNAMNL